MTESYIDTETKDVEIKSELIPSDGAIYAAVSKRDAEKAGEEFPVIVVQTDEQIGATDTVM
jgi:hypothetical protein